MNILIIDNVSYLSDVIEYEAQKYGMICTKINDFSEINELKFTSIDVIISLIGNDLEEFQINQRVIGFAESFRTKFLLISSFGCGDSWLNLSLKAKKLFGLKVRFKTLSEEWLKSSQLNWKIIRPVGLTREKVEGDLSFNNEYIGNGKYINIYDFAGFLVKVIINNNWVEGTLHYAYMVPKKD